MEEIVLFVHHPGVEAPIEINVTVAATGADLLDRPEVKSITSGLEAGALEVCIFVDEEVVPLSRRLPLIEGGIRHGSRVHLSQHHEVEVEVYFMHRTAHHRFPPGVRVRRVKDWAVGHFGMAGSDAIEHVLQLHCTAERPSPAMPLTALVRGHHHKVAFELVPSKRVEG